MGFGIEWKGIAWLVNVMRCGLSDFNFQTSSLVASFEVTTFFLFSPRIKSVRGPHSLPTGEGGLSSAGLVLGPVHFSCYIPGRKGFQLLMVRAASRNSHSPGESHQL